MGLWGVWKVQLKGALVPAAMQSPPATQQQNYAANAPISQKYENLPIRNFHNGQTGR